MKIHVLLISCLAMGAMMPGCDAARHVPPGSVSALAENGVLPRAPRDMFEGLRGDPTCPIAGFWIRQGDAYATMVLEIQKNLQGDVSGTLLYVPPSAQANNFRRMDMKLRQLRPTRETLREYEGLSLCRYAQDPSLMEWTEVTIQLLEDDKLVLQEKVWAGRELGHRQVWQRVARDSAEMAYVHDGKARIALQMGDLGTAASHLAYAVRRPPDDAYFCNDLAWELAVSRHAEIRRPRDAISLAQRACQATAHKHPSYLDTLAAAFAADGRFADAIDAQQKALREIDGFAIRTLESLRRELNPTETMALHFQVMLEGAMTGHTTPDEYLRKLVLSSEGIDRAEFQHRLTLYQQGTAYVRP